MSNEAINWAFHQDLPMARKFVLIVLANYADEAHSCYPGQKKIADKIGASVETVRRALTDLEAAGLISRERRTREGGYRTSDRYYLPVDLPTGQFAHKAESASQPVNARILTGQIVGAIDTSVDTPEKPKSFVRKDGLTPEFLEFYAAYPLKGSRPNAAKAYQKALTKTTHRVLVDAAERYTVDPNRDPAFTKLAATWLNAECWDDPPLPPRGRQSAAETRLQKGLTLLASYDEQTLGIGQ